MRNNQSAFQRNLIGSIQYVNSRPKEPSYINKFFPILHQRVLEIKKQNPGITLDELKDILQKDQFDLAKVVYFGSTAPDMYTEYACSLYLESHPERLKSLTDEIQDKQLTTDHEYFMPSQNFSKDLLEYLLVLQKDLPNLIKNYDEQVLDEEIQKILASPDLSTHEKQKKAETYMKAEINPLYYRVFMTGVNLHLFGIRSFVGEDRKAQEKILKEALTKYIAMMGKQFHKYGFLERYNRSHTKQMVEMNLDPMTYSLKDLEILFNENYLSNLPVDELLGLSVFWLNRYMKELDIFAETLFAVREFDLLPQMLSSDKLGSIRVPEEQLKQMLIKMNTLYLPSEKYFQEVQDVIDHSEDDKDLTPEEDEGNYVIISYDPLVERVSSLFGNEYTQYFQQRLPDSENDLEKDLRYYAELQNPITSGKSTKDEYLTSLLISLGNNPNLVNGGILLPSNGSSDNVLYQRFVGIALDCKLTAPVRQHIRFEVLREYIESLTGDTKVQIYEGHHDFEDITGKTLSNHMILPFSKKIEKTLKILTGKNAPRLSSFSKRYLRHTAFLKDPKQIPDHLATFVEDKKGKKEKILQKRYFDLVDGQIYVMQNGEYIPYVPGENNINQPMKGEDSAYERE